MTAVAPDPESTPPPLAPISYSDMEGRSYRELAFDGERPHVRDSLESPCLMCGGIGRWSSHYADAIYVAPPGHRMEYIEGESLIVFDSCQLHVVI